MKIAITGTHRSGKTTLVDKLQECLPEYVCKAEAYYELEERGNVFSEIPTLEDYILQLEHSIEQISAREKNLIFDRCPLDMLAYIQATTEFKNANIQSLYHRVKNALTQIDILVFVPIEEPDVIGCPESDFPELRLEVNEILNDWIWDFGIDTIEVSGSPSDRCARVMKHISALRK
jgi:thymidylate kinase